MTDDDPVGDSQLADAPGEEYELQAEDTEDLDAAMREALKAVERTERKLVAAEAHAAGEVTAAAADAAAPGEELARLEAELADLRDRSVRTLADFDNYRKRVARERREELRYAAFDFARELLDVVDNLERALAAEGNAEDLKVGVQMIHKQLDGVLRRHGIRKVPAAGEPFDPSVHEAVTRHEDAEVTRPTVSEELQSGYMLEERLLRPARVNVVLPVAEPDGGEEEGGEKEGGEDESAVE